MSPVSSTISLRLPDKTRQRLDDLAIRSRRSRSYIIQRALELHLNDVVAEEIASEGAGRYSKLRSMAGAGSKLHGGRSREEIDSFIDWLRGDD